MLLMFGLHKGGSRIHIWYGCGLNWIFLQQETHPYSVNCDERLFVLSHEKSSKYLSLQRAEHEAGHEQKSREDRHESTHFNRFGLE